MRRLIDFLLRFFGIRPPRSVEDVLRELAEGLRDGSITLGNEDRTTCQRKRGEHEGEG